MCVWLCVLLTGLPKSTRAQLDPRARRPQSMQQTLLQMALTNTHTHELMCVCVYPWTLLFAHQRFAKAQCVLRFEHLEASTVPPLVHAHFYVFHSVYVCVCISFIACCQAQQHIGLPLKNICAHFSDSFHKIVQNVIFLYIFFTIASGCKERVL